MFVPHNLKSALQGAATGPLQGLTCVVKDMFDITGDVAGAGNPAWLAVHAPAKTTADVITRLLDAGATITGKAACDEFFYSILGANAHYGTPRNPRTPDRHPGGSSSGSAVSVANGAADFALGSDTGGSIRIPAMATGLYGIRPTHGRVSLNGVLPLAPSFDTVGWFAARAGMLKKIAPVLLQHACASVPVTNVLHASDVMALADPAVSAVSARFQDRCAGAISAGSSTVIAPDGLDNWSETFRVIQAYEAWQAYGPWLERHDADLGPGTRERFAYARTVTGEAVAKARGRLADVRRHLHALLHPGTVLVIPTAPALSPALTAQAAELDRYRKRTMEFTCIAGLGGLPQISMPAGNAGGAPVGISLVGGPGSDETLLDLAVALSPFCGD